MVDHETQFSVSRIHRLLRPLRCILFSSKRTHSSTSTRMLIYNENAPLELIPPPAKAALFSTMNKENRSQTVELSRKFYAIRDCFRNVVAGALGKDDINPQERNPVPSLASICAKRMGECINHHIEQLQAEAEADEEEIDETSLLEATRELFDAVPSHQRRWSVVGHALDVVLASSPLHPTLTTLLLEVCAFYKLNLESARLLQMLLLSACSPSSDTDRTPMLAHPSHSTYLIDLLANWTTNSFTESQFIDILVEVLSDPRHSRAWSSKAVIRLSGALRSQSLTFPLFLRLIHGAMTCIYNTKTDAANELALAKDVPLISNEVLLGQLAAWLTFTVDNLLQAGISRSTQSFQPEAYQILQLAQFMGLQYMIGATRLAGPILSFATICLTLDECSTAAVGLMEDVDPKTPTYDPLVASLSSVLTGPSYTISDLRTFIYTLEEYATALQSALLPRLEASLWACALRHFDPIRPTRDLEVNHEAANVKVKLIANVESSERRCFAPTPSKPRRYDPAIQSPNSGLKFVWESSLDCWLRRQTPQVPRVKRRKVDDSPLKRALTRSRSGRHSQSRQADISSTSRLLFPPPMVTANSKSRRMSYSDAIPGFTSLLSTALSNRTTLHEKENIKPYSYASTPCKPKTAFSSAVASTSRLSPPASPVVIPSSDDALDLFSYNDSL